MKTKYEQCHFCNFESGLSTKNLDEFARDMNTLMEKYDIKSICPTHLNNAEISRHINDKEIHFVGMYFEGCNR